MRRCGLGDRTDQSTKNTQTINRIFYRNLLSRLWNWSTGWRARRGWCSWFLSCLHHFGLFCASAVSTSIPHPCHSNGLPITNRNPCHMGHVFNEIWSRSQVIGVLEYLAYSILSSLLDFRVLILARTICCQPIHRPEIGCRSYKDLKYRSQRLRLTYLSRVMHHISDRSWNSDRCTVFSGRFIQAIMLQRRSMLMHGSLSSARCWCNIISVSPSCTISVYSAQAQR